MDETEAGWVARKLHEALNGSSSNWTNLTVTTQQRWINAVQFLIDSQLLRAAYGKIAFDQTQLDSAIQDTIVNAVDSRVREVVQSASIDDDAKAAVFQELNKTEG